MIDLTKPGRITWLSAGMTFQELFTRRMTEKPMLDLKKPIRRKIDREPVFDVIEDATVVLVTKHQVGGGFTAARIQRAELERDYENVPEPRKSREWWVYVYPEDPGGRQLLTGEEGPESRLYPRRRVRLIEWAPAAPLPELPE